MATAAAEATFKVFTPRQTLEVPQTSLGTGGLTTPLRTELARVYDRIRGQTADEERGADRLEDVSTLIEALVSSASEGRECIVVVHDAPLEKCGNFHGSATVAPAGSALGAELRPYRPSESAVFSFSHQLASSWTSGRRQECSARSG